MLFMGEEYGSSKPFPFFTEFGDPELVAAVREGRRAEFASFRWQGEPPDPQSEHTVRSAVLDWGTRERDEHADLLALHARLIAIRRTEPGIHAADAISTEVLDTAGTPADGRGTEGVVVIRRRAAEQSSILLLNFAPDDARFQQNTAGQAWRCVLDTAASQTSGGSDNPACARGDAAGVIRLAPHSAVLLLHDEV
jgi:maltooligosyltrehalose trehalohydrolase